MITITDVKIRKIIEEGRLKAIVSIILDNEFAVHDIKIIKGDNRLFVAMPSRKDENGIFRDIVHPMNPNTRAVFEKQILDAYEQYIETAEFAGV